MSAWHADELRRLAGAEELEIAPVRRNGELRRPTVIWAVQADEDPTRLCSTRSTPPIERSTAAATRTSSSPSTTPSTVPPRSG